MDVGYEGNHLSQTFEGLEQKFLDEISKPAKEQNDAEDSENAWHREVSLDLQAQTSSMPMEKEGGDNDRFTVLRSQDMEKLGIFLLRVYPILSLYFLFSAFFSLFVPRATSEIKELVSIFCIMNFPSLS
ncbi:hypothetical protein VNO77_28686 [Canavalia gladiata]|uniref:Uncharacterized protein n=1 Tax=Canavalia gladiata TaxID=3824 RepID=A0AAN9KWC0_CANGL